MGMENGLSAADIAAVTDNRGYYGGNGWGNCGGDGGFFWIFALLILLFGGNGFGFGGRDNGISPYELGVVTGNNATKDTVYNTNLMQSIYENQVYGLADLQRGQAANTRDIIANANMNTTQLGNGICTLGYETLGNFKDLGSKVDACCCTTQRMLDGVKYDDLVNTNAVMAAVKAEGEATRALIQTNEIQALRDKVNSLEMDSRFCGVVRYPLSTTYTSGGNPFCGGWNNGCGCN